VNLIELENARQVSRVAALLTASLLRSRPSMNVVAATGNTPMATYRELSELQRAGMFSARDLRLFQLDEYVGVGPSDPRSLVAWTRRAFARPLGIPDERFVHFASDDDDPEEACERYQRAVAALGGFQLAILGLGPNGHLGFNEPPSGPEAATRVVPLAPESLSSNARYWGGAHPVPTHAMTAGMDILLASQLIVLLVVGAEKRSILRRVLTGSVSSEVPASHLRERANAIVIADRAAMES
jgi:glucosamine-6-phosphate deaminase